jgi:hypothetical protein
MKRIVLIVGLMAATLPLASPGAHAAGIYGIIWTPKPDGATDGYGGALRFDSHISPMLTLDTRFGYVTFPDEANDLSIMPFEFTVRTRIGTMLYGGIGVGYYRFGGNTDIDGEWGWYLLGGISIPMGRREVFGEFKWQNLDSSGGDLESYVFHLGVGL